MNQAPRTLSYNPAENAVLLTSDVDGGSYELYKIPKDARGDSAPVSCLSCARLLAYDRLLPGAVVALAMQWLMQLSTLTLVLQTLCVLTVRPVKGMCFLNTLTVLCCVVSCHGCVLQEAKRGLGASAVFIARNRFAVLDKASGQIQVSHFVTLWL
jgi:hypothetical protein